MSVPTPVGQLSRWYRRYRTQRLEQNSPACRLTTAVGANTARLRAAAVTLLYPTSYFLELATSWATCLLETHRKWFLFGQRVRYTQHHKQLNLWFFLLRLGLGGLHVVKMRYKGKSFRWHRRRGSLLLRFGHSHLVALRAWLGVR